MIPLKPNDSDDLKRYILANILRDGLYADAKAAYMRVEDAMNQKQLDEKNGSSLGPKVWKWAY
ncbi:MAG: hypothetical protein ACLS3V_06610 [Streptococcus sp.]